MRALVFAMGNPLRADDGVAQLVCRLLDPTAGVEVVEEIQLCPEMTARMKDADLVIFVDADPDARTAWVRRVEEREAETRCFSHMLNPASLVLLARRLFGFRGEAWICQVPARDFTLGGSLTEEAESSARIAAAQIDELLAAPR